MTAAYPPLPVYSLEADLIPLARLERDRMPSEGDKASLLLEAKKLLERTPHFFEPTVDECVNATGLLVDTVGVKPTSRGGPCPALPSATCPYELSVALAK